MSNAFQNISEIIRSRRSAKPAKMNGKKISDTMIKEILSLADWAPTHGRTEPWRFVVYAGEQVQQFCHQHAEMYKENTAAEKFNPVTYEKLFHQGDLVSHIAIAVMKRTEPTKIPADEEALATAAAVQNILLASEAAGIASFWSTGGMTHQTAMKKFLDLKDDDKVIALIYLGYTDEKSEGKRQIPLDEKIKWIG
jgi:nitroreductase